MITYKNITDVEVLEQASENTKVLVNEGGELMQAPYSNFEDKMKDAEVLEEIPENAMALVNDGGKLKQVACGVFSGVVTAFFKQDGYDNALAGVASATAAPEVTYTCINMTFDEACQVIMSGQPIEVIFMTTMDGAVFFQSSYNVAYEGAYRFIYAETDTGLHAYWTSDGISTKNPEK